MYEAESRKALKQDVRGIPDASQPSAGDDDKKTKKQLIDELAALRHRVKDLEAFEAERKAIATELKGTRQRLQYLLAVSPAIIYTTKATGDLCLHLRKRKSPRYHGLYDAGDDHRPEGLAGAPASRRRTARLRRDASSDRAGRRIDRVSLPPS